METVSEHKKNCLVAELCILTTRGMLSPLAVVLALQESEHKPSSITLLRVSMELKEHSRQSFSIGE